MGDDSRIVQLSEDIQALSNVLFIRISCMQLMAA